uniref:Uncharacterized protein n=1 Tax=Arundo donax TaxID=35708 RepID=A0A0A9DUH4_ARUDO
MHRRCVVFRADGQSEVVDDEPHSLLQQYPASWCACCC